ncbi:MAG: 3'(2'),5'-bisphosphate nucleotidase [Phycisphaeraceae bacterium]|nr:3'(2'),5'-bisphosphate nucleotidase [Phycisphaeraceae bacterium]
MNKDFEKESAVAVRALREAASVCRDVQASLAGRAGGAISKQDRSPVTVADFASQALICRQLAESFPHDAIVAEEGTTQLRQPDHASERAQVIQRVGDTLGTPAQEAEVLAWIDRGAGRRHADRFWTLDPIDGTKGFIRGDHYAIALALIEEGHVVFGALACPRMSSARSEGVLMLGRRGGGVVQMPLWPASASEDSARPVRVSGVADPADAVFCESYEPGHSDQAASARIAARLGLRRSPLRMDGQAKYVAVARGDAMVYMRLPTRADYREHIWDHAAGAIVVAEAGGRVTDARGEPLDFSSGPRLEHNSGIIASNGAVHAAVLDAIGKEVRDEWG